jgi:hypothetical protein
MGQLKRRWKLVCCTFPTPEFYKKSAADCTFSPGSLREKQPIQVTLNTMAPTTPFNMNPFLWLLQNSTGGEGGAGTVAVVTLAKKRQGKKALKTLKILNNFGSAGRRNPLPAKLDGGVSRLEIAGRMPRKRSEDGTPCKKARGREEPFLFRLNCERVYAAASAKANPPSIAADKYNDPEDWGGALKAFVKGGHGVKVKTVNKNDSDDDDIMSIGAKKPAPLQALAAVAARGPSVTRSGRAGAIRGDGGAGTCPDNNVMAAAQLALVFEGCMPDNAARAAFEGFPGAEVVRRAPAALRNNTNDEEEPGAQDKEDGFIIAQDNDTKEDKTLSSKAPKVQQGSSREAHQKTQEEAHHHAYGGGRTLGLSSDGEDGETGAPDTRPGSLPIDKGRKARLPNARQGSLSLNAPKANQKTNKVAHHPTYWGGGTHRWALEGEDKKARAPKARQAEDAEAWVQAERGYKDAPYVATQKKPNQAAHQGSGTCSPQVSTALFGLEALFGPTAGGKHKGKTRQGVSAANFLPAT